MDTMNLLMLHICFLKLHLAVGSVAPSYRVNVVHKENIPFTMETEQQTPSLLSNPTEKSWLYDSEESTNVGELTKPSHEKPYAVLINEPLVMENVKSSRNTTEVSWPAVRWLPKSFLSEENQATNEVYRTTIKHTTFPFRRSQVIQGSALQNEKGSKERLLIRKKRSWMDLLWLLDPDDYMPCEDPPCPTWSGWHGKGSCDSSCGGGKRLLIRYCEHARDDQDQGGCTGGENTQIESCNTHSCPSWSDWTPKGTCSSTCGPGVQTYKRICMKEHKLSKGCFGQNFEYRICNNGASCPAQWTTWSKFGPCTDSCGVNGFQLRKRACVKDGRKLSAQSTKIYCKGYSTQQKRCPNKMDCKSKFSEWSAWSHCDAVTCDTDGRRTRTRHCFKDGKPKYASKTECNPEDLSQSQKCRTLPCVKACEVVQTQFKGLAEGSHKFTDPTSTWSQWSSWSECSVSCGLGGRRSRSRMCFSVHIDASSGNVIVNEARRCEGKSVEHATCQYNDDCPHWDDWQTWSECSRGCGIEGRKKRTRLCIVNIYKVFNSTEHKVSHYRTRASEKERGHIFRNEMNGSSEYPVETVTSYPNTTLFVDGKDILEDERMLDRKVVVHPSWCKGGKNDAVEAAVCNDHPCLPKWREWQAWSECSVTCGRGQTQRVRKCSIGNCHGAKAQFKSCYSEPCMTPWSNFSPCTKSCGGGDMSRYRKCIILSNEDSQLRNCTGSTSETSPCNEELCPVWSEWGSWGECSGTCTDFYMTENMMSRKRKCLQGNCIGHSIDTESCNIQPCPYWSPWTAFSCCSVSCGDGVKTRTRGCRNGDPGEQGCIGNETDVRACNMKLCSVPAPNQLNPELCGVRPSKMSNSLLKIFNGKISSDHQWPWQASWQHLKCITRNLGCRWEHLCGATLIGPRWVVTAAHCIENIRNYRVTHHEPGDSWSVVIAMTKLYETGTRHFIRRIFLYEDYRRYPVPKNDISLLKLRDSVQISTTAVPACLPTGHVTSEEEECFITGWGNTDPYSGSSVMLREAKVPFLNFTKCEQIGRTYQRYLSADSHMCAGDIESSHVSDSCEGDSGGPLVCLKPDGRWYLAGITSFGFEDCGTPGHPGIYAPVVKYEQWIRHTISVYTHDGC